MYLLFICGTYIQQSINNSWGVNINHLLVLFYLFYNEHILLFFFGYAVRHAG